MLNMTKREYARYVKEKAPSSRLVRDTALAWLSGGLICVAGQGLIEWFRALGMTRETAPVVAAMTLVAAAAFLTAIRVYDRIAKWAGAGTIIPITGFANAMVAPAMEFKTEGHVAGMASKMFVIAGPVIVYGVLTSAVYGVVLWVMRAVGG
ncbi:MAG: SpoVA/SpoVAEb family sporulation membrane protein [Oscillospiraceae bacterium]|nr:SpoVA/SpoVAEb family sporulation membrane protein [Oscillospiraceae bacterium]